ncbi:MAG: DUF1800 domain-containing protein [Planctomycetota bacterium]
MQQPKATLGGQGEGHAPFSPPSRRTFLRAASALAATAALSKTAQAAQSAGRLPAGSDLDPVGIDPRLYLMQRATFGFRAVDWADLESMGHAAWLDWQLNPAAIPDAQCDAKLALYPWRNDSPIQMANHATLAPWELLWQYQQMRLYRATLSKRQVFERVVEFWTDHFNVYGHSESILKIEEDRQRLRPLALGKFRDLLIATAKGGCMMEFLDNESNVVGAPNENYAREVMELHTLGVTGPYTEQDVRELARCFTGWNYVNLWVAQNIGGNYGDFRFLSQDHDYGPKTVLGQFLPGTGGVQEGENMLAFLADHASTRRFVCTKLCRWFLGYEVSQAIIQRAENTWTQTDGLIREVVRTILSPANLSAAKPWLHPKVKRPHQWMISVLRSLDHSDVDAGELIWSSHYLGQPEYLCHSPQGYLDQALPWASRLQPRWLYSSVLGHGWWSSINLTTADCRARLGGTPKAQWMRYMNQHLCGGWMPQHEANLCQRYLDLVFSAETDQAVGEAFELLFSSPSFQLF